MDLDQPGNDPGRVHRNVEVAPDTGRYALECAAGRDCLGASHRCDVHQLHGRAAYRRHTEDSDPEYRDGDDRFQKTESGTETDSREYRVQELYQAETAETCSLSGHFGAPSMHNAANRVRILGYPGMPYGAR